MTKKPTNFSELVGMIPISPKPVNGHEYLGKPIIVDNFEISEARNGSTIVTLYAHDARSEEPLEIVSFSNSVLNAVNNLPDEAYPFVCQIVSYGKSHQLAPV